MSTSATDLNKQGHPNSTIRDIEAGGCSISHNDSRAFGLDNLEVKETGF
jgi:hypothetical protein